MSNERRTTSGRGRVFGDVTEAIGDTPCIRINALAPDGVELYVKAEFFNPAASVKDRLAISIIEEAERSGKLKPGQTVPAIGAEWVGAKSDTLQAYKDICGFTAPGMPITWPQVLAAPVHIQMLASKEFPMPAMGIVHVSQHITQHTPLPDDAVLDISCNFEGQRFRRPSAPTRFQRSICRRKSI